MNKKNFYSVVSSILAACIVLGSDPVYAQGITQKQPLHTIIIDPGHGGVDPGAHGQFSTEAAVALSVSLKLGQALAKELPECKVIFTRTTDELAGGGTSINESLRYRANLANQSRGDLFIAIHCNAAGARPGGWYAKRVVGHKNKTVYVGKGSKRRKKTVKQPIYETYWVKNQQHGTETFIWAADRVGFKGEAINQTEEGGEGGDSTESGEKVQDSTDFLDLESPEAMIRAQLYEKKYFGKSLILASFVEEEFIKGGRSSRGVKQRNEKGIWVLQATGMPSILVETGFVTHTEEEEYINSEKGQEEIVTAIMSAIKRYKAQLEGHNAPALAPAPTSPVTTNK